MKKHIYVGMLFLVSACANTSGIVPLGDGSYLISRSEKGFDTTGSAVKADAIKEAGDYCKSQNRSLRIANSSQKDMVPFKSDAQAEIEFKCVNGDAT